MVEIQNDQRYIDQSLRRAREDRLVQHVLPVAGAGAVPELDLRKKFHMQATELAKQLNLTLPKAAALRDYLKIGDDKQCTHTFEFGKTRIPCYSDNATRKMKDALAEVDMDDVWKAYRAKTGLGGRRASRSKLSPAG
jgi:hypothetical protein